MLHRKREALKESLYEQGQKTGVILTNCPSCVQGLSRNRKLVQPKHLSVALAERITGPDWQRAFAQQAAQAQAVTI
jgi:Fe-S oxidoreductase